MSSADPQLELLASIESGQADQRILEFAARGFVPLSPSDLVRALTAILQGGEPGLSALAEETFRTCAPEAFVGAVLSDGITGGQLDAIAHRCQDPHVIEPLIRSHAVQDQTLAWLAERIPPNLQDVLVTNQARLLAFPLIVERLFENPDLSSDIRRRADEFLEEFFLKKERLEQQQDALRATGNLGEALPEAQEVEEPGAKGGTEGPVADPLLALSEDEKKSLLSRVALMTVKEKIKLGYTGTREERLFLIHDSNRLVATAVLKSPKTNEADAEVIANMKSVSEDVLRAIGGRREWVKKYAIVLALARNPRAPVTTTLPLVARLSQRDQKTLSTDRNIPEVIRVTARRAVMKRED